MEYLLLAVTVLCISLQDVTKKIYTTRKGDKASVYGFLIPFCLFNLLVFTVLCGGDFTPDSTETVLYGLAFGVLFSSSVLGGIVMLNHGSMMLAVLVTSYSLLIPTLSGVVLMNEPFKLITGIGIALLCLSILFMALKKEKNEGLHIDGKWIIAALFCFFGNGLCSTVQKLYVYNTGGSEKYLMSFIAMIPALLICTAAFLFNRKDHDARVLLGSVPYAVVTAAGNTACNVLIMLITGLIPAVVLYPVASVGSIIISALFGIVMFKERPTPLQYVGYAVGIAAVALLNL